MNFTGSEYTSEEQRFLQAAGPSEDMFAVHTRYLRSFPVKKLREKGIHADLPIIERYPHNEGTIAFIQTSTSKQPGVADMHSGGLAKNVVWDSRANFNVKSGIAVPNTIVYMEKGSNENIRFHHYERVEFSDNLVDIVVRSSVLVRDALGREVVVWLTQDNRQALDCAHQELSVFYGRPKGENTKVGSIDLDLPLFGNVGNLNSEGNLYKTGKTMRRFLMNIDADVWYDPTKGYIEIVTNLGVIALSMVPSTLGNVALPSASKFYEELRKNGRCPLFPFRVVDFHMRGLS